MQEQSEGVCAEKGLLQRIPDASVFLLLTAPSLLCGSSLFAAQVHKKYLFQKLEGDANSQITISFVTTLHPPSEKFHSGMNTSRRDASLA